MQQSLNGKSRGDAWKLVRENVQSEGLRKHMLAVEPVDHALFACDELCGLIMATALVKPSKSLNDVDARSVLKKMKDKGFARSVNRDDIVLGAQELGKPLEDHVEFVVQALQGIAPSIDP
jgi:predicted hydrolase (HD superfamily)